MGKRRETEILVDEVYDKSTADAIYEKESISDMDNIADKNDSYRKRSPNTLVKSK